MHSELYELGTSNDEATVKHRKKILKKRQPYILRADLLYTMKEEYFALKEGAARNKLESEIKKLLSEPIEEKTKKTTESSIKKTVVKLSDIELIKRRLQLRSNITKKQNLLQYQTITKGDTPAPLPRGEKRDKIEQRLQQLQVEYTAVVDELNARNIK